jgi:type II secretory pathway pseudopilin PulG
MKRWAGFTLVELMVAAALTLLGIASALSLIARGRGAYQSAESRVQLEETARAALDLLAHETRMAGYLGLAAPASEVAGATPTGTQPPPELAAGGGCTWSLAIDLAKPLAGADGRFAAGPDMPLGCGPAPLGRAMPGADTLIVRRAAATSSSPDAGRLQLESRRFEARLLADGQRRLGDDSLINDIATSVFYVSRDATGAAGHPALRRKRLVGGSAPAFQDEELVAGVEDLQVEAGIADPEGDDPALLRYVPLDALPAGAQLRSIRLWVLVRGDAPDTSALQWPALAYANRSHGPETSRFPRLLASRTVALRNPGPSP